MPKSSHIASLAITICLGFSMAACEKGSAASDSERSADAKAQIKTVGVGELEKLLATREKPAVYDANSEETRSEYGVIPGAKLLSSSKGYDVGKELPANKEHPLVFYCGSLKCQAAEGAAGKAVLAGYTDVGVMREGIRGWAKAGKPTTMVN